MKLPLQQLIAMHETRLLAVQVELNQALAALTEVAGELRLADDELAQIRDQKSLWESQWQHWLRRDGVLYRGQAYNLRHITLASWENEVVERRTKIQELHRTVQEQAQNIRTTVLKVQHRIDLLKDRLARLSAEQRLRRVNAIDTQALEEMTFHGWVTRQSVHRSGGM